jgi:GLPGLI family protein
MNSKVGIKVFTFFILFYWFQPVFSQDFITSGKIVFERRTNLEKRYTDKRMKRMITEENKIKMESFSFFFNDTVSVFKPILSDVQDPMGWMTSKNSYLQSLNSSKQLIVFNLFGQNTYIKDSLPQRNWKITENKRTICGYECRKAIYEKNDSTRIYAWYSPDIVPSIGPEGFCGLPGTILGVATEDGGIIYFAKTVEVMKPKKEELVLESGKKTFTLLELKQEIETKMSNSSWGKGMNFFDDLFRWL